MKLELSLEPLLKTVRSFAAVNCLCSDTKAMHPVLLPGHEELAHAMARDAFLECVTRLAPYICDFDYYWIDTHDENAPRQGRGLAAVALLEHATAHFMVEQICEDLAQDPRGQAARLNALDDIRELVDLLTPLMPLTREIA